MTTSLEQLKKISQESKVSLKEIAYMGDDVNDIKVLKMAGLSIVPNDCEKPLKKIADYICLKNGGNGCVREICNLIMEYNVPKDTGKA